MLVIINCQVTHIFAKTGEIVHFCKFSDGVIGYYDRPCEYVSIMDSNKHSKFVRSSRQVKILEQDLSLKDTANKQDTSNKQVKSKQVKRSKVDRKVANRCDNAIEKIALIQDLLQNNLLNSNASYKKILIRLKRSLNRYNKIKKEYCLDFKKNPKM